MTKKIYLASPFFNDAEITRMKNVLKVLRDRGFDVFAPFELKNEEFEFGSMKWRDVTFKADVDHIDSCDVVVAINSQGNYDDAGTMWEIGYSYATKKPIVVFNDSDKILNLMVANSLTAVINNLDELKTYDFDKLEKIEYTGSVI